MRQIDAATAAAVSDAVRAIERESSAELVVEVRAHSGSYAHADSRFGVIVAYIAVILVVFTPWMFAEWLVPLVLVLAYGAGLMTSRALPVVRRLMTTGRDRESRAHDAAAASFMERGIANTRERTGILLFLSLLERRFELIADRGVLDAVPNLEWNQLVASIRSRPATADELPDVIRALAPLLRRYLPVGTRDVDELPDELRVTRK